MRGQLFGQLEIICTGSGSQLAGVGDAIADLKLNCRPPTLLPEINGSYQRCPPNSSQRMGPSLFSNCVKILWNLKEIVQSNDDGSPGVNMEQHVRSSHQVQVQPPVAAKLSFNFQINLKNKKVGNLKNLCFDFIVSCLGVTRTQESRRIRNGHDSEAA